MKAAIRDPDPVVFLENELLYGTAFDVEDAVMESDFVLPIGKAKIQRAGTDISLVAHSIGVGFAMDAAELLAKEGISCEVMYIGSAGVNEPYIFQVVNLRSIRPLDMDTVNESVKKTGHAITVEGGWPQHGVGAEISACISEGPAFHYLDAPVMRITGADAPMPYAASAEAAATPQVNSFAGFPSYNL